MRSLFRKSDALRQRPVGFKGPAESNHVLEYHVIELKPICGRLRDAAICRNGSKNLLNSASETFDMIQHERKTGTRRRQYLKTLPTKLGCITMTQP
ncbi:hypothetical protein TNCV_4068161 [Trichonephila clavipes]|nr:hypothetical protein TNCV_4068161 [Trichonephila clavipes]